MPAEIARRQDRLNAIAQARARLEQRQKRTGFLQFSLRGLHRVQAEWKLVCLALNLRRMGAMKVT